MIHPLYRESSENVSLPGEFFWAYSRPFLQTDLPCREPTLTAQGRAFPETRWTLVLEARRPDEPRARQALEELCRQYWFPIYSFLRRRGWGWDDAQDLTQSFFAGILSGDTLQRADQARGRLRTLLLAELKKQVADQARAKGALKRGRGVEVVSLDQVAAEERFALEPQSNESPDRLFDRAWAHDLLRRTKARLRESYAARLRTALFDGLVACLAWNDRPVPYRELAARLDLSEPAVRLQVFRLRQKYRELLEAEVADTVASPADFKEELEYLLALLRE